MKRIIFDALLTHFNGANTTYNDLLTYMRFYQNVPQLTQRLISLFGGHNAKTALQTAAISEYIDVEIKSMLLVCCVFVSCIGNIL